MTKESPYKVNISYNLLGAEVPYSLHVKIQIVNIRTCQIIYITFNLSYTKTMACQPYAVLSHTAQTKKKFQRINNTTVYRRKKAKSYVANFDRLDPLRIMFPEMNYRCHFLLIELESINGKQRHSLKEAT